MTATAFAPIPSPAIRTRASSATAPEASHASPTPPTPEQARDSARTALIESLAASVVDENVREIVADRLIGCLDEGGRRLNFDRLSEGDAAEQLRHLPPFLPPSAWRALQDYSAAQGDHPGIDWVVMRKTCVDTEDKAQSLSKGLSHLAHVRTLTISAPSTAGRWDLRQLDCGGKNVEFHFEARRDAETQIPLTVQVPEGAVVAACRGERAPAKARVTYWRDEQQVGPAVTLDGLIYHREPCVGDVGSDATGAQRRDLKDISTNCIASFTDVKGPKTTHRPDPHMSCCHLVPTWIGLRRQHHADKQAARQSDTKHSRPAKFDYGKFSSKEQLLATVKPELEGDEMDKRARRPLAQFESSRFGEALIDQFVALDAAGQTPQHYLLETENHVLGVELQKKGTRYVVIVFDPNETATHRRYSVQDLDELRDLSLEDMVDTRLFRTYFGQSGSHIASLLAWAPDDEVVLEGKGEPTDTVRHGLDGLKLTPEYLDRLMRDGCGADLAAAVREVLDDTSLDPTNKGIAVFMQTTSGLAAGLRVGMHYAHNHAPAKYLKALVDATDMSAAARYDFFRYQRPFDIAIQWGRTEQVAEYMEVVAGAPEDSFTARQRKDLLNTKLDNKGRHALHRIAVDAPIGRSEPLPEMAYAYARQIAVSGLSLKLKKRLLASNYKSRPFARGRTAAQAALAAGHRASAAAIVAGALQGHPLEAIGLLKCLKVDVRTVLERLVECPAKDRVWVRPILERLPPSALRDSLRTQYADFLRDDSRESASDEDSSTSASGADRKESV